MKEKSIINQSLTEKLVGFFARRHLLVNIITVALLLAGAVLWTHIPREELPDMELNFVRVNITYPGSSPSEVEYFVTRPVEDELRGVDGIYRITSNSNAGVSAITIELEDGKKNYNEIVTEIRNAVLSVNLPDEIRDTPFIKHFKTSLKAIVDLGVYIEGKEKLDDASRRKLQESVHNLENRLLKRPELNSISRSGYLKREYRIDVNPVELSRRSISLTEVMTAVKDGHVRRPAGDLENIRSERVVVRSELDSPKKLGETVIRGLFEGHMIYLKDVARVRDTYRKGSDILRINGNEGILLRVVKSGSAGILDAMDVLSKEVELFNKERKGTAIKVVLLDDESRDVRNRLALVGWNGLIGFILILLTLIAFLNLRAAFWVAMGIPFSLSFTMLFIYLLGMTINNITLAGIIIVLGMVVDDAIVVAENIEREKREGYSPLNASVLGTNYVLLPIIASVVTTSVAFLPLLGIEGRIGMLNEPIPIIITLMLFGSLFESIFLLPGHMNMEKPAWLSSILGKLPSLKNGHGEGYWFHRVEDFYERVLNGILRHRKVFLALFVLLPVTAVVLFFTGMKFVMFPGEEIEELIIIAEAPMGTTKEETAKLAESFDVVLKKYIGKEIVGFRTLIAKSRWGGEAADSKVLWRVEFIPFDKRTKPLKQLKREWKKALSSQGKLKKIRMKEMRFGQKSGSPIEILVQDNNDNRREKAADRLSKIMESMDIMKNVEINRPMEVTEHQVRINRPVAAMLGINTSRAGLILRSVVEGTILYELVDDDTEINVRLTVSDRYKRHLRDILNLPVANNGSYLVPLRELLLVDTIPAPSSINRQDYMRTTTVYSDIQQGKGETPLTIAEKLEKDVFPRLAKEFPQTIFSFDGEIKDTRESSGSLKIAVITVLLLIYGILAILFGSMVLPLIIMLAIPFGAAGVIIAFKLHGMNYFGFFAAIGVIGLSGVVVNDSIVMVVKIRDTVRSTEKVTMDVVSAAARTRLRAVLMTTISTVAGLFPTAYGLAGYDSMLSEMMLAMAWGLITATAITLVLVPVLYSYSLNTKGGLNR